MANAGGEQLKRPANVAGHDPSPEKVDPRGKAGTKWGEK